MEADISGRAGGGGKSSSNSTAMGASTAVSDMRGALMRRPAEEEGANAEAPEAKMRAVAARSFMVVFGCLLLA